MCDLFQFLYFSIIEFQTLSSCSAGNAFVAGRQAGYAIAPAANCKSLSDNNLMYRYGFLLIYFNTFAITNQFNGINFSCT